MYWGCRNVRYCIEQHLQMLSALYHSIPDCGSSFFMWTMCFRAIPVMKVTRLNTVSRHSS